MSTAQEKGRRQAPAGGPSRPRIRAAGASDAGRVRQSNQDRHLVDLEAGLFIVSDGMGGHQAGEVAAQAVVTVLPRMISERSAGLRAARHRVVELTLRETILQLSQRLRAGSAGRPGLAGMGATVVLAWLPSAEGVAYLAHMGDSRSYLLRRNRLSQLTEDHSLVALLLQLGEITPDQAARHPARGQLSRYVGMEGEVYPDVQTLSLRPGDRLLLCTDGLTGMVPDEQIAALLRAGPDPAEACRQLVRAANAAGGRDNITALVVDWGQG